MAGRLAAHAGIHGLTPYQAVATGFRGQTMICPRRAKGWCRVVAVFAPAAACGPLRTLCIRLRCRAVSGVGGIGPVARSTQGRCARPSLASSRRAAAFDVPELLRLRGEFEARGGDSRSCRSELCGIGRAGRTAGRTVLAVADGDVACPASSVSQGLAEFTRRSR